MPDDKVTVPEVASVTVSKQRALRLFVGRAIVDYIETFAGLAVAQVGVGMAMPASVDEAKALAIQLVAPALAAAVSAGRRAWPTVKAWLLGEQ